MGDLVYVTATVGFFAAMILYVRACERLGASAGEEAGHDAR
jgi:hypothetical protein